MDSSAEQSEADWLGQIAVSTSHGPGFILYIASSDPIPEMKHEVVLRTKLLHVGAFAAGVGLIPLSRALVGG
jgi:hypothetical protein